MHLDPHGSTLPADRRSEMIAFEPPQLKSVTKILASYHPLNNL
jgi:hypothetical protein